MKIFRSHHVVPDGIAVPLYRALLEEWVSLHQLSSTTRQLRRWAVMEPVLAGLTSPGEIVDAIDAADYERTDEFLLALIRLFHDDHQLAGRIVLQAALPRLCSEQYNTGAENWRQVALAEFWMVLGDYPLDRRPRKVMANLTMDTYKHTLANAGREEITPGDGDDFDTAVAAPGADPVLQEVLAKTILGDDVDIDVLLSWGIQQHVIDNADAQVLRTYYLDPGRSDRSARGRKRCSRLVAKLRAAVQAELMHDQALPQAERA